MFTIDHMGGRQNAMYVKYVKVRYEVPLLPVQFFYKAAPCVICYIQVHYKTLWYIIAYCHIFSHTPIYHVMFVMLP